MTCKTKPFAVIAVQMCARIDFRHTNKHHFNPFNVMNGKTCQKVILQKDCGS